MQTRKSTTRKPFKAVVGAAHHALRAYAKAYDLRSEGKVQHRYFIPLDGRTASILNANGDVLENRPIEEWAAIGPQVRRALIALKFFRERISAALVETGSEATVRFCLDILEGRAVVFIDSRALSKGGVQELEPRLGLGDGTRDALAALPDSQLETVAGWAVLGKQVEIDFFQILQTAERYGLTEAAQLERQRGYRLSIIRRQSKTATAKR